MSSNEAFCCWLPPLAACCQLAFHMISIFQPFIELYRRPLYSFALGLKSTFTISSVLTSLIKPHLSPKNSIIMLSLYCLSLASSMMRDCLESPCAQIASICVLFNTFPVNSILGINKKINNR